jgi:hypothetical protein
MKYRLLFILMLLGTFASAQKLRKEKIKLFVDCSFGCDMSYIRTEINLVDFVLDNKAADVHVLITSQELGNGGDQAQLIFFGQHDFAHLKDTIFFNTEPNATDFEIREQLVHALQAGLMPYISRTEFARYATISMKQEGTKDSAGPAATKDPWNYWVYRISTNGGLNGDQNYKSFNYNGNISASRVTDKLKTSFRFNAGANKTEYSFENAGIKETYTVNNENYNFNHLLVKSVNQHWSYGYIFSGNRSTFSNYRSQFIFNPAIEYNIFPYKEVNNKYLTLRYGPDLRQNRYFDTTLYRKTHETLFGQGIDAMIAITQKWGNAYVGLSYHSYLHKPELYNVGMYGYANFRITGGLSVYLNIFGGIDRDQIYLSGEGVEPEEVLTRRRQLASNFNYWTNFGISYRFGSKLNNFVNPRFEGPN